MLTSADHRAILYFLPDDWKAKRDSLAVQIRDLPELVAAYKNRQKAPYPVNPLITMGDPIPGLRLINACEGTTNTLYGMAEITAQFAAKASNKKFPRNFNSLRKNAIAGKYSAETVAALGDLQWYEKVREMRTEWSHYSTAFIGEDAGEPIVVVRSHRSREDRKQFPDKISVSMKDLAEWTTNAIFTLEGFAAFVCRAYSIPALDLNERVIAPKLDLNGIPIITQDHRFDPEHITVGEQLKKLGIIDGLREKPL